MKIKKQFADRIRQSIYIYKNNFVLLTLPFLLFFIFIEIGIYILSFIYNIFWDFKIEELYFLLYDVYFLIYFTIVLFLALIMIILLGGLNVFYYKNISDIIKDKKPDAKENLLYSLKNLYNYMLLYWYIFKYVLLIPSIIFIFSGIFIIVGYFYNLDYLYYIGAAGIFISSILLISYYLYRGTIAKLGLSNAINEGFSEKAFKKSLDYSKNKVLRLFGNLLFFGFIVGAIYKIIILMINFLGFFLSGGIYKLFSLYDIFGKIGENELNTEIEKLFSNDLSFIGIFIGLIDDGLNSIIFGISSIFIYLIYERYKREFKVENESIDLDENAKLSENKEEEKIIEL